MVLFDVIGQTSCMYNGHGHSPSQFLSCLQLSLHRSLHLALEFISAQSIPIPILLWVSWYLAAPRAPVLFNFLVLSDTGWAGTWACRACVMWKWCSAWPSSSHLTIRQVCHPALVAQFFINSKEDVSAGFEFGIRKDDYLITPCHCYPFGCHC